MFRSIFKKLRGKSTDENAPAEPAESTDQAEADATAEAGTVSPGIGAARKSVVSAPKPIPSAIDDDPVEDSIADDGAEDTLESEDAAILDHDGGDTALAGGAINPIAAASAAAAEVDPVVEVEADPEPEPEPLVDEVIVSAEELCDIDPDTMDREEIRARLAVLYRRYNAVASSLNAELRAEAEQMLDAIVACREAYVDHL